MKMSYTLAVNINQCYLGSFYIHNLKENKMDIHEYDLIQETLRLLSYATPAEKSTIDDPVLMVDSWGCRFGEKEVVDTLHKMGYKTQRVGGYLSGWYYVQRA